MLHCISDLTQFFLLMLLLLGLLHIFLNLGGERSSCGSFSRKHETAFKSVLVVVNNDTRRRNETFALHCFSFILGRLDAPCIIAPIFLLNLKSAHGTVEVCLLKLSLLFCFLKHVHTFASLDVFWKKLKHVT